MSKLKLVPNEHTGPERKRGRTHRGFAVRLLRAQAGAQVSVPSARRTLRSGLVSSFEGRFEEIALTIPPAATTGATADIFKTLLGKLPDYTRLIIVVTPATKKIVKSWLANRKRVTLVEAPEELHFSFWAEDPFCVRNVGRGRPTLLDPLHFNRYGDSVISTILADEGICENRRTPLLLQGGNMLVGDTFVLVGVDEGADSMGEALSDGSLLKKQSLEETVRAAYRKAFERDVLFVGTEKIVPLQHTRSFKYDGKPGTLTRYTGNHLRTAQPVVHIDMFLTLVGRAEPSAPFEIMVGDPSLAAELLNRKCLGMAQARAFDDIAKRLQSHGFLVTRNPMPLVRWHCRELNSLIWAFASTNNCLVERTGKLKRVWLPSYSRNHPYLRKAQTFTKALWRKRGFEVIEVPNCDELALNLGSIHCIKKYLRRGRP